MNSENSFPLTVRITDFNLVAKRASFIQQLRSLTLYSGSGMNHELNHLLVSAKTRMVNCKIISAHHHGEMVGWALLSKEATDYHFTRSNAFNPKQGVLFQVFVNPAFRRKGIGTALMKAAKRKAGTSKICVCPWDYVSEGFFNNFEHYRHQKL